MGQLMSNDHSKSGHLIWSRRVLSEEQFITVGDTAWELHCSHCKLRTENHIVLSPVAFCLEEILVEFDRLVNEGEDVWLLLLGIRQEFWVEVYSYLYWKYLWVVVAKIGEVSCYKTVEISAHCLGLLEFPNLVFLCKYLRILISNNLLLILRC